MDSITDRRSLLFIIRAVLRFPKPPLKILEKAVILDVWGIKKAGKTAMKSDERESSVHLL
jgi:hypothetical protein